MQYTTLQFVHIIDFEVSKGDKLCFSRILTRDEMITAIANWSECDQSDIGISQASPAFLINGDNEGNYTQIINIEDTFCNGLLMDEQEQGDE